MLGLSRWGEAGCSYRTVQHPRSTPAAGCSGVFRVYARSIDSPPQRGVRGKLMWQFFWHELYCPSHTYVLIGDKTVVSKAGKATHGLESGPLGGHRFFSSLHSRPIRGLCFQVLALASVEGNGSCPVDVMQVIRSVEEKTATAKQKAKRKPAQSEATQPASVSARRAAGRKKGSKNKDKVNVPLSPDLQHLHTAVQREAPSFVGVLGFSAKFLSLCHLVMDGEYGHSPSEGRTATPQLRKWPSESGPSEASRPVRGAGPGAMAGQCHLHLIRDPRPPGRAARSRGWASCATMPPCIDHTQASMPDAGRGPRRKYGAKLKVDQLPHSALIATQTDHGIETRTYQLQLWHTAFPSQLNVVMLVKP